MYRSTSCFVTVSVHFPPDCKKYLLPKGLPVEDALLSPETITFTYSVKPTISLPTVLKLPLVDMPSCLGVLI